MQSAHESSSKQMVSEMHMIFDGTDADTRIESELHRVDFTQLLLLQSVRLGTGFKTIYI